MAGTADPDPVISPAIEDDEHDCKDTVVLRFFLQEWELVKSLLDRIVAATGASDPISIRKILTHQHFLGFSFPLTMSDHLHRGSRSAGRQSLFYRDLASPISAHRGASRSPSQAAAVSALWRENFAATTADLPPPPVFSLDDRPDFSPEPEPEPLQPASASSSTSPSRVSPSLFASPSPLKAMAAEGGSGSGGSDVIQQQLQQNASPGTSSWWSPVNRAGSGERSDQNGKSSPVDGVIQPGALITLPPPREVARPEVSRNGVIAGGGLNEEEWVTVYGFAPADTNLVLREFEKCGVILKHVPGPRDANWMHILYQNRFDARKALRKDGMQINSVLIIGVKSVDPGQVQFLDERHHSNQNGGFMVSLPPRPFTVRSSDALTSLGVYPRPNYLHTTSSATISGDSGHRPTGAIASPAKSVVSKVMDLMFGI